MQNIQVTRAKVRSFLNSRGIQNRLPRMGKALIICPPGAAAIWIDNLGNDQFSLTSTGTLPL